MKTDEEFVKAVEAEILRARTKFPDSTCSLAALMEEVGELANALLEEQFAIKRHMEVLPLLGNINESGGAAYQVHRDIAHQFRERVFMEAVQVAVMAQRVAIDGDRSLALIQSTPATFPSQSRA